MKSRSPPERSASSRSVRADWSRAIVGDLLREPWTEHAEDHAVAHLSGGPLPHPQIPPPRGTLTRCGYQLRERLATIGLRTRMALHTGEVEQRGDNLGGIGVHLAARVLSIC